MCVPSLGQEDPLEKEMANHSSICLDNSLNRGACWATVHGVTKESDMTRCTHRQWLRQKSSITKGGIFIIKINFISYLCNTTKQNKQQQQKNTALLFKAS